MCRQAESVGYNGCLVDKVFPVTHEQAPLIPDKRLLDDIHGQDRLAGAGRSHYHLYAMSPPHSIPQELVCGRLEWPQCRERGAGVVGCFFWKEAPHIGIPPESSRTVYCSNSFSRFLIR